MPTPSITPFTVSEVKLPTLVTFGCAGVVTIPAVFALVAVVATTALDAVAALPPIFKAAAVPFSPLALPVIVPPILIEPLVVNPPAEITPVVLIKLAIILPDTVREVRVPTLVILGCAAV